MQEIKLSPGPPPLPDNCLVVTACHKRIGKVIEDPIVLIGGLGGSRKSISVSLTPVSRLFLPWAVCMVLENL